MELGEAGRLDQNEVRAGAATGFAVIRTEVGVVRTAITSPHSSALACASQLILTE
ncbi:hypothetical protein KHQ06_25265 [Nocardia tengchongensis]|uniref:Uncharacterized protein n=1 Tax=Nocardia tengchongensis TaxID=2055889 RepID=A0ABX8CI57_9NOCA|nr:hypothetical protein [Nocardia tengchongensis]QVI19657.1 hypothetical protein KHQ06_25265 [Nocardia tengchongensis]